jgi:XTP/dITP diphosphohydrolase
MDENVSFKRSESWKNAMTLAVTVGRIASALPDTERHALASQIRANAALVPACLAQYEDASDGKEQGRLLRQARAALVALQSYLVLAKQLGYLSEAEPTLEMTRDLIGELKKKAGGPEAEHAPAEEPVGADTLGGMKTLVIATHNPKKAKEMSEILGERFPQLEWKTLADYPNAPEPEETGTTYAENALIKAQSAARHTGEWSVADDAGLEIDAMDGAPGLHSKRFAGEQTPFDQKMRIILERLQGLAEKRRGARFRVNVALAPPDSAEPPRIFEGVCEGRIAFKPVGEHGFGYDPIFYLPELGKTMAQLPPEEKHKISHRGMVLARFAEFLEERLGG